MAAVKGDVLPPRGWMWAGKTTVLTSGRKVLPTLEGGSLLPVNFFRKYPYRLALNDYKSVKLTTNLNDHTSLKVYLQRVTLKVRTSTIWRR